MEVRNIQKRYKKKIVLRDISFTASAGQCIGILGGNGSGKSTLLSILSGVLPADAGHFLYQEKDLLQEAKLRRNVLGYVPQGTPLLEELTALDNLRLWYDGKKLKQELANGALAMLGIPEFLHTPVQKMSGGMKKRLTIGCAISGNPDILLLDEPSAALDLVCREKILEYLRAYKNQGGIVLLATHDVQEIELCDRWYILRDGVLIDYAYDGEISKLVVQLTKKTSETEKCLEADK